MSTQLFLRKVYKKENLLIKLKQLIKYLTKSSEITHHQEYLKEQKYFDKLEQKRIAKERLKQELGSFYIKLTLFSHKLVLLFSV